MEVLLYEQDRGFILARLKDGEFDYIDAADEVVETEFFRRLACEAVLKQLADTYPTPRQREDVPRWVYIASNLSLRLHGVHAFHAFPYVVRAGGMLSAFGPGMGRKVVHPETGDLSLECDGFNNKNSYSRQTPCSQDYLRKLARDTHPEALFRWYNQDVVRILKRQKAFDEEGLFLGDGSYLFVPNNERYEGSALLLFDENGHPLDSKKLTREEQARYRWRRCYKLVSLLHVRRSKDLFVYGGLALLPGNAHESPVLYSLVDGFVEAVGPGVMRRLILDRGFLDGAAIGHLKRDHGIDVLIPLRKDMDLYEDALALMDRPETEFRQYRPPAAPEIPEPVEPPAAIRKREAKRQKTIREKRAQQSPRPPEKTIVRTEVAAISGFQSWESCPVPLDVVINRETYGDGHQEVWMLLDTKPVEDAAACRDEYGFRGQIEERHRHLKCFADLTDFTSPVFSLVANQVVFIALAYSLLQLFLLRKERSDLNRRTPPRVRQEILPTQSHIIVYCEQRFAFFTPLEFAEVLLSLEDGARRKALQKTRQLRANLREALRRPRAP